MRDRGDAEEALKGYQAELSKLLHNFRNIETHDKSHFFINYNLGKLAKADPHDIQKIAASQIELMLNYHNVVLDQARRSFLWAIISGAIGVAFFVAAVASSLRNQPENAAIISAVSGAIVELLAGSFLYLYGKATAQLADFHQRLDTTQRHLLANSIAASMDSESQKQARLELIRTIARVEMLGRQDT